MRTIALTFLLLLGCAASGVVVDVADLTRAPDFDEKALKSGGLAVLGFVGELPDMHESHEQLSNELAYTLSLWLPDVPITRRGTQSGPAVELARERLAAGSLTDFPFDALRELTHGTRYLVAAELRSNEVIHTEAESSDEDTYCTTRAIRVRYRLLDLAQKRAAFQGIVSQRSQDCNENSRGDSDTLAAALVNIVVSVMQRTYPDAPKSVRLVRKASRDFASLLPGSKEPPEGAKPKPRAPARAPLPQAKPATQAHSS